VKLKKNLKHQGTLVHHHIFRECPVVEFVECVQRHEAVIEGGVNFQSTTCGRFDLIFKLEVSGGFIPYFRILKQD
jgi:hypothetical protein